MNETRDAMERLDKWRQGLLLAGVAAWALHASAEPVLQASFNAGTSTAQLDFILSGESFSNVLTVDVQTLVFDSTALTLRPFEQVLTSSPALSDLTQLPGAGTFSYDFFDEPFGGYEFLFDPGPTIGPGLLFRWTFDVAAGTLGSLPFEAQVSIAGFDQTGAEYQDFRSAETSLSLVPEPSSWTLLAAGLFLLAAAAARRRRPSITSHLPR
jgi:hypothetical protein